MEVLDWLWTMTIDGCEVTNPDLANTRVMCAVIHETAWSRALGVGPYSSEFALRVMHSGDEYFSDAITESTVVQRTSAQFPVSMFVAEAWGPFLDWVEERHPDDLAVMFSTSTFSDEALLPNQPLPAQATVDRLQIDDAIVCFHQLQEATRCHRQGRNSIR